MFSGGLFVKNSTGMCRNCSKQQLCICLHFPLPHKELDWDHQLILAGTKEKKSVSLFTVLCVCAHMKNSACFRWIRLSSRPPEDYHNLDSSVNYNEL